jgi:transposase
MEEIAVGVSSPPTEIGSAEGLMLKEAEVRAVLSRIEPGEKIKAIARELGVDRKTIKRWRRVGGWCPQKRKRPRTIDRFTDFISRRGPEVGWNAVVLYRELCGLGFTGTYQHVQRPVQPLRCQNRWAELATVRYETGPGEQAQVDFGQLTLWIGDKPERAHLFAFTLGYSRRIFKHTITSG